MLPSYLDAESPTHLGSAIIQIIKNVFEMLSFIWTRDYSVLEKGMFGVSFFDVISVIVTVYALGEILKAIGKGFASIGKSLFRIASKYVMYLLRIVLLRAKYTFRYFWNKESTIRWRQRVRGQLRQQIREFDNY